ncbi:integrase [Gossypium australe]|uniref:Integrase n=1 Tax=Gossypium australe TaxID=47621 RepID=A0A5B6VXP1_9ROSI|nr:integrase [Gossypium australe]
MFQERICVLRSSELIHKILNEAHISCLSEHPESTKMYNDLKQLYWWHGMKHDISEFVSKCLICQQVKVQSGLLQPVVIPEWKWDKVIMDFVSGLPLSPKKKDAIWVKVDRLTKSLSCIFLRSLDCTECPFLLFRIEIRGSLHDFGRNCKKLWAQSCISVQRFIPRLTVNLRELFKFSKICCVVAFYILRAVRRNTYH